MAITRWLSERMVQGPPLSGASSLTAQGLLVCMCEVEG